VSESYSKSSSPLYLTEIAGQREKKETGEENRRDSDAGGDLWRYGGKVKRAFDIHIPWMSPWPHWAGESII